MRVRSGPAVGVKWGAERRAEKESDIDELGRVTEERTPREKKK